MKDYKLVPYKDTDHDDYIKIQKETYIHYILDFFGVFSIEKMEEDLIRNKLGMKKILYKNKTAGYVYFMEEKDKIQVDVFTLLPEFRNFGLGTQIMSEFTSIANKVNKPIFLATFKTNPAKRFYERNGFVVVGENQSKSHFILKYSPKTNN